MDDLIRVNERWYVGANSPRADHRTRVLKHGEAFALFDRLGDIQPAGLGEQGLYREGTRFLSSLEFRVNGSPPLLLNSAVSRDNREFSVDLTLPALEGATFSAPRDSIHIRRSKRLRDAVLSETVALMNYGQGPVPLRLALRFAADYADIFEVRGKARPRRGSDLAEEAADDALCFGYRGLDGLTRRTRIRFETPPARIGGGAVEYELLLAPRQRLSLGWTVHCELEGRPPPPPAASARSAAEPIPLTDAIYSSNEQFNDWLGRSAADLDLLVSETPHGPYPYAGVPWFSAAFGRDGIITALQTLWLWPELARGVLSHLAALQSNGYDAAQDAEPGKILHEARGGEMAALGEVPFGRYYGSIDATPLFVVLAAEYHRRSGDLATVRQLWPAIEAALRWIEQDGDRDGDGFVEYARRTPAGLEQQGWKDSQDSVFHADGTPAAGPIALCEVQGYVYAAQRGAARLARALGEEARAEALDAQAAALRRRFDEAFWCEDIGSYALALDGDKRPCRVRASNAGHALWSGIAKPGRAAVLARTLMDEASFAGWGVRTLAESERRYNPMSYHNGSIWPHDNAMIAAGLARYGHKEEALRILTALFDASLYMELARLPELYCGFPRQHGQGPTLYPVACAPQAWAAGSVFQLLQACLGLGFGVGAPQLRFERPRLPRWIDTLEIRGLRAGDGAVDLVLRRHANDVSVNLLRRSGGLQVSVLV